MTWLEVLTSAAVVLTLLPVLMYLSNFRSYHRLPELTSSTTSLPAISILIPARNEEAGISATLDAIQANAAGTWEVIVMDDQSTDRTLEIVKSYSQIDSRIRYATAPQLPPGWSGKQHACYQLSKIAKYDLFLFLDADVRLAPDAVARISAMFTLPSQAGLLSGFPRQETLTFWEMLLIPLMHWLLLSYLSLSWMRRSKFVGLGAGCGQLFVTTRNSYEQVGGHSHLRVRGSWHDGIQLPRAYRLKGIMTDLFDATDVAVCRMYRSGEQVRNGLAKNAREGLGAPKQILMWTVFLLGCSLLPICLIIWSVMVNHVTAIVINTSLVGVSLLPRIHAAMRFRQPWLGVLLHPLGVFTLLCIQWYANLRAATGRPVGWRNRIPPLTPSSS